MDSDKLIAGIKAAMDGEPTEYAKGFYDGLYAKATSTVNALRQVDSKLEHEISKMAEAVAWITAKKTEAEQMTKWIKEMLNER